MRMATDPARPVVEGVSPSDITKGIQYSSNCFDKLRETTQCSTDADCAGLGTNVCLNGWCACTSEKSNCGGEEYICYYEDKNSAGVCEPIECNHLRTFGNLLGSVALGPNSGECATPQYKDTPACACVNAPVPYPECFYKPCSLDRGAFLPYEMIKTLQNANVLCPELIDCENITELTGNTNISENDLQLINCNASPPKKDNKVVGGGFIVLLVFVFIVLVVFALVFVEKFLRH